MKTIQEEGITTFSDPVTGELEGIIYRNKSGDHVIYTCTKAGQEEISELIAGK